MKNTLREIKKIVVSICHMKYPFFASKLLSIRMYGNILLPMIYEILNKNTNNMKKIVDKNGIKLIKEAAN